MNIINEMNLSFCAKSINESFARSAISAFVLSLDPTIGELSDIKTAVSEAVTNCIVHAYGYKGGIIYINARITDTGKVIIRVRDKGCGMENVKQAMEPLYTTGGEERAGLGFAVMQSFMDKVSVRSTPLKGTTVTMEKAIIRCAKNDREE
ncbi:MAG: anti-sigma F factor [Ruminococcaceae bacterium]|nr:anti-sigma F factor [Oscillospiraceae bacterium]